MRYRLVVEGSISPGVFELLEETTVGEPDGQSVLFCEIADQAKLQAVLSWLGQAGVELVACEPLGEEAGVRGAAA